MESEHFFTEMYDLTTKFIKLSAVLSAAVMLTGCIRAKIDPNDYLELRLSGLDTAASAECEVDYEGIVRDNLKAFGIESPDDTDGICSAAAELEECLSGSPDRDSMLSNGDVINFEWNSDEVQRLENEHKIKLRVSNKTLTVSGLEEAKKFDPFEYLTVDFTGASTNGVVKLNSSLPVKDIGFTADRCSGLSNGESIVVRFGSGSEEEIKAECFAQGYVSTCFEKEYIVNGLGIYVTALKDISKASYDKMDAFAQKEFEKFSAEWTDKKIESANLIGAELYTPENDEADWGKNALCYIYEVKAEIGGENITYYYFTYFLNVYSPDNYKNSDFSAESAGYPSYSEFYTSMYGDAFKENGVIIEGFRTVEELEKAMSERFGNKFETNINSAE